jgi:hypothetical protein
VLIVRKCALKIDDALELAGDSDPEIGWTRSATWPMISENLSRGIDYGRLWEWQAGRKIGHRGDVGAGHSRGFKGRRFGARTMVQMELDA